MQRTHKDTLFRYIFRDKRKLLQLYNAINGSDYQDISRLQVTTVENVIYLGYKNDLSFLLDWVLYLLEHQGSWNPNMPLRGVLYFARLYEDFVEGTGVNIYGTKQIALPYPQYIVFYNGTDDRPEREVLRLSDAFEQPARLAEVLTGPALECEALVLNINYGSNQALLEKCRPLLDYSKFIFYIREYTREGCAMGAAVNLAVDRCLKENILSDVLKAHRREVVGMFLEEYDQELHYKTLKQEGYEQGCEQGLAMGRKEALEIINALNERLLQDGRSEDLYRSFKEPAFQEKLLKEYGLWNPVKPETKKG